MGKQLVSKCRGKELALSPGKNVVVGRDKSADLWVNDPLVSRNHLRISEVNGRWVVTDLKSTNGVFIYGKRIRPDSEYVLEGSGQICLGGQTSAPVISYREQMIGNNLEKSMSPVMSSRPVSALPPRVPTPKGVGKIPPAQPVAIPQPAPIVPQKALSRSDMLVPRGWTTLGVGKKASRPAPSILPAPLAKSYEREIVGAGNEIPIPEPGQVFHIGRAADNEVVLPDPMVSAHHAILSTSYGRLTVTDLGSTNGVFINGFRVRTAQIHPGDVLTAGRISLRLQGNKLVRVGVVADGSRHDTLIVDNMSFLVPTSAAERQKGAKAKKALLDQVSFAVPKNSLLAVIGPSGAGKSTLLNCMMGKLKPQQGATYFEGLEMSQYASALSDRISAVPQDDLLHLDLTGRKVLEFAAKLRFPDDTPSKVRKEAVSRVINQLDLQAHADTKVKRMSGGQRKRVSTAMELLDEPDLLFLDEPTSGLDPNLDREVMALLAKLAHGYNGQSGRTVVVITHSTANLHMADNVLLLAPGGKVAYFGSPAGITGFFAPLGVKDFPEIYDLLSRAPDQMQQLFLASGRVNLQAIKRSLTLSGVTAGTNSAPSQKQLIHPKKHSLIRQSCTLFSRQMRLMLADPLVVIFTVALPLVMAILSLVVPGKTGFVGSTDTEGIKSPGMLLVIVVFGAVLMGLVPAIRELVRERAIFRRESAVGLRLGAYLLAKVISLGLSAVVQAGILTVVITWINRVPDKGVVLPFRWELFFACLLATLSASSLGLFFSALVRSAEQTTPVMIVLLMVQLVMCGGVIDFADSSAGYMASYAVSSQWAYSAGAASVDLNRIHRQSALDAQKKQDKTYADNKAKIDKRNEDAKKQAEALGQKPPQAETLEKPEPISVPEMHKRWKPQKGRWLSHLGILIGFYGLFATLTAVPLSKSRR